MPQADKKTNSPAREETRKVFYQVWHKMKDNEQIVDPMESCIANIIQLHPEYQPVLEQQDDLYADFHPDLGNSNPFLHMGMHIAIQEQLSINQPSGICDLYQELKNKYSDIHQLEHIIIDCLGQTLWQAQRQQKDLDASLYLGCIRAKL